MPTITLPITQIVQETYKFIYSNFWTILKLCLFPFILMLIGEIFYKQIFPNLFGRILSHLVASCAFITIAIPIHRMIILAEKPTGLIPVSDYKKQFLLFLFFSLLYDFSDIITSYLPRDGLLMGGFMILVGLAYIYFAIRLCVIFPFFATRSNEGLSHLNFDNFSEEIWSVSSHIFSLTKDKALSLFVMVIAINLPIVLFLVFIRLAITLIPGAIIIGFLLTPFVLIFMVASNVTALSLSFMILKDE